jgi:hypothetical protein
MRVFTLELALLVHRMAPKRCELRRSRRPALVRLRKARRGCLGDTGDPEPPR